VRPPPTAYQHDVFVSYSHVDNLSVTCGEEGWIEQIVRHLERKLLATLGRSRVWYDPRLGGNHALWPELSLRLRQSVIFLAVVSPPYSRSRWCRRELLAFLENHSGPEGSVPRIVRVMKYPCDEHRLAPDLRSAPTYCFYDRSEQAQTVVEWLPRQSAFRRRISELASHIQFVVSQTENSMTRLSRDGHQVL
jgi:hypothetical protein